MALFQQTQDGDPIYFYSTEGWLMNAMIAPHLQRWPMWPLVAGVDGRTTHTMRRFRGFRRLDNALREYNESGILSKKFGQGFAWHPWYQLGVTESTSRSIIDMHGIMVDRPGRTPVVGFATHAVVTGNDRVVLHLRLWELGNTGYDAFFHYVVYQSNQGQSLGLARVLEANPVSVPDEGIDRVAVQTIGRLLFTSHKYAQVSGTGADYSDHSGIHVFTFLGGTDKSRAYTLVGKVAGNRGFERDDLSVGSPAHTPDPGWFIGPTAPSGTEFVVVGDAGSGTAPHDAGSKLKVRLRFVNKTTGYVGPMSDPQEITLDSTPHPKQLRWAKTGTGTNVVAADMDGFLLLRSLVGGALPTPTETAAQDVSDWDVRLQIFVTTSTDDDNPSHGGGVYYLDSEVSLAFARSGTTGYTVTPSAHAAGTGIPTLSNDELVFQELYDPEFDQPGELTGGVALGDLDGILVSLDAGAKTDTTVDADVARGDIRFSPPWQFSPTARLESVAYRSLHRVQPRWKRDPKFLKVGSLCFLMSQNKVVRMIRQGTRVQSQDIGEMGPVNREACDTSGSSIFLVTDADVIELNPVTAAWQPLLMVHEIVTRRWREYVRDGRMMCGFDPQLNAVFIAPKIQTEEITEAATYTSATNWERHECVILWLTTGRVTMLYDCYWVAMARGVHPLTGKQHLFFVDPIGNITYPDSGDADDGVATMVGVSGFAYPDLVGEKASLTITISGDPAGSSTVTLIEPNGDTTVLTEGVHWNVSAGNDTATAASLASAITSASNDFIATSSLGVVTVVAAVGAFGEYGVGGTLYYVEVADSNGNMTVSPTDGYLADGLASESHTDETWGGVTRGTATTVNTVASVTTVTDSACDESGKGTFDQYGFMNDSDGAMDHSGALIGAQVYFFRQVTDPDDSSLTVTALVADGRIRDNTKTTFQMNVSEINFHVNPATGSAFTAIATNDQYSISPVVLQVVGPPLDGAWFPHTNLLTQYGTREVGYSFEGEGGFAASGATQYPTTGALQGDMFLGVTDADELESRGQGAPLRPGNEKTKAMDLTDDLKNQIRVNRIGLNLMPVLTNFGASHNFDLLALWGTCSISPGADPASYDPNA